MGRRYETSAFRFHVQGNHLWSFLGSFWLFPGKLKSLAGIMWSFVGGLRSFASGLLLFVGDL